MKITRRPEWLQKKVSPAAHADMERLLGGLQLHTVCQEAHCPNISECFRQRQATFLILGKLCTRLCSFCNVTKQTPLAVDQAEPERVAAAVELLKLTHVVVTSPTRDDLADGGAALYAATVAAIRNASPQTKIELLVPDFAGNQESIAAVVSACPHILGHNLETVPRLYSIRSGADYRRSLLMLEMIRRLNPAMKTKTGLMLGLGETEEELFQALRDLRRVDCSYLSLGQYLAPSRSHYPVQDYPSPETFDRYREQALSMGFEHVESGPYVRSSYHAEHYGTGTGHAKLSPAPAD
ncbi:lipoate synthase [Geotalea daltonii FRC-32]|uniref:Lipoyl synthase n=1 Tax=Geotalea daltonii (strain DSM 22248 / JCM 15807 / FRC-32) TaxID=316067 RepID=LIPA_GEODF|nr:lipoyl synthase [Geotalea daltonii]B9M4F4.1 RecName: Full=Lipoyl synthase; AltName: Full=Lip-syn; Short=LS; AltName: Full=Lipoate synthase; AltName: Full=Lipoic acid synthase; AltName: Full=Sulfur insertion protein LipA [Geotalea daltonii FRC-32]ACM19680.1 lipoate synthase [Geotalea daltonii FRC-32]